MPARNSALLGIIREAMAMDRTKLLVFGKTALLALRETAQPDPDQNRIRDLISSDPALSGQVLRVANSPYFRTMREATTIDEAMLRLGLRWVANIVFLMSRKDQFKAKHPMIRDLMNRLWRHAVGCGVGSHWLIRRIGRQDLMHEAFLAGVLHDEGKLFLLTVLESLLASGKLSDLPPMTMVLQTLDLLHTEYGHSLLKGWNLPAIYCEVAKDHHRERYDTGNLVLVSVRLVDKTCNALGIGLNRPSAEEASTVPAEVALLKIDDQVLSDLRAALTGARFLA